MEIERVPVSSSNLVSVGYDPDEKTLIVEFKGGALYSYSGVPKLIYDRLLASESKGSFFSSNIKPVYMCSKLSKEKKEEKKEEQTDDPLQQVLNEIDSLKKRVDQNETEISTLKGRLEVLEGKKGVTVQTGRSLNDFRGKTT